MSGEQKITRLPDDWRLGEAAAKKRALAGGGPIRRGSGETRASVGRWRRRLAARKRA